MAPRIYPDLDKETIKLERKYLRMIRKLHVDLSVYGEGDWPATADAFPWEVIVREKEEADQLCQQVYKTCLEKKKPWQEVMSKEKYPQLFVTLIL